MKDNIKNTDRYQSLFHHLRCGVMVYKTVNDGKDFILTDANKALEDICKVDKKRS